MASARAAEQARHLPAVPSCLQELDTEKWRAMWLVRGRGGGVGGGAGEGGGVGAHRRRRAARLGCRPPAWWCVGCQPTSLACTKKVPLFPNPPPHPPPTPNTPTHNPHPPHLPTPNTPTLACPPCRSGASAWSACTSQRKHTGSRMTRAVGRLEEEMTTMGKASGVGGGQLQVLLVHRPAGQSPAPQGVATLLPPLSRRPPAAHAAPPRAPAAHPPHPPAAARRCRFTGA